jgi:alkyl hydroperoxide reductase 1
MSELKVGDSFPEGVTFQYIPYTPEIDGFKVCGMPVTYNASKGKSTCLSSSIPHIRLFPPFILLKSANTHFTEWANKKVVLFALPGAFTPACSGSHLPGYIENLDKLRAKGVDQVAVLAYNDPYVMSAWGKANGVKDDSIVRIPFPLIPFNPLL